MIEGWSMESIYTICMVIGIVVPLFMLLLGGIFHVFDGVSNIVGSLFDGFDISIDIGDTCISFLPFSIHSICAGLLLYGTIGRLIFNGLNVVSSNIIAGICGYVAAVVIQTLIQKLKKVEHRTYATDELLLYEGKVINKIIKGGFGSISITTLDGITLNYPAKAEDRETEIKSGTVVEIVFFSKNIAIVREKDLTMKYDRQYKNEYEKGK